MTRTWQVLSVRNPWPWLIFHGGKNIENRKWSTPYRGPLLIHAAAGMTRDEWTAARIFVAGFDRELSERMPLPSELPRGVILGQVMLANCFRYHTSPWFQGPVGWLFEHAELWDRPVPAKGRLGLWEWKQETP